jgi:phosphate transport system substrate-binding protein
MTMRAPLALLALLALGLAAGCGGNGDGAAADDGERLSGRVQADGSSTVAPFATAAAERFGREHRDVRVTVGVSGTGGGFDRFCRGETDISNASRPIKDEERELCEENGVEHVEFQLANDGLAVVVHPQNDWAECLTIEQLQAIWRPQSDVDDWNRVPGGDFPDAALRLAGPGTDSGTFDFFTEAVNGESGASRADFTASEDDNVIVQAVSGDRGGLGYFGLSYVEENQGRVRAVAIENEDGDCVEPSVSTVQDGTYNPLSRPLYVYAKKASFERREVEEFIRYILDRNREIAEAALFVPLTEEQLERERSRFEDALAEVGGS